MANGIRVRTNGIATAPNGRSTTGKSLIPGVSTEEATQFGNEHRVHHSTADRSSASDQGERKPPRGLKDH
ncbi:MAG: hypothetical protein KA186_12330, partial [Flavobacteriales bacterium]|nr:hypothetical protein [Flavobacteriales bacterium]